METGQQHQLYAGLVLCPQHEHTHLVMLRLKTPSVLSPLINMQVVGRVATITRIVMVKPAHLHTCTHTRPASKYITHTHTTKLQQQRAHGHSSTGLQFRRAVLNVPNNVPTLLRWLTH